MTSSTQTRGHAIAKPGSLRDQNPPPGGKKTKKSWTEDCPPEFQQFECELYNSKPIGKRFRLDNHTLYSIANFGADLEEADAMAKEAGTKRVWVSFPPLSTPLTPTPSGWRLHNIQTRIIDLSKSEEQLWHDIRHGHQSEITKAKRNGLQFTKSTDYAAFLKLARQNYKGYQLVFNKTYDKWLPKLPNQEMWCVTESSSDKPLAMAIIRTQGDLARYQSGATDYSRNLGQSHTLQWSIILMLKGSGFRWYEVGTQGEWFKSGDKTASIAHFKAGFGGSDYPLYAAEKFYSRHLKVAYMAKRRLRKMRQ